MDKKSKDHFIHVRVSQQQEELIQKNAMREEKSKSAYVIDCCTKKRRRGPSIKKEKEILSVVVEMQNSLNNLKFELREDKTRKEINDLEKEMCRLWQLLK